MNKKGFTLIEVIICISILALMTVITVPNILKFTKSSDSLQFYVDADKVLSSAMLQERTDSTIKAKIIYNIDTFGGVKLNELNNLDIDRSSYGSPYDLDNSFIFKYKNEYYICLTDNKQNTFRGKFDRMTDGNYNEFMDYEKPCDINNIKEDFGF